jgi:hypothetical protein
MSNLPGNVEKVQALLEHPAFDIKNPNKVYSLVGGLCASSVNFHNSDGSGYAFLGDLIVKLDALNPQVCVCVCVRVRVCVCVKPSPLNHSLAQCSERISSTQHTATGGQYCCGWCTEADIGGGHRS